MKINRTIAETATEFYASMARAAELPVALHDGLVACEQIVTEGLEHNFDAAQTSGGVPWPKHSPVTIAAHGPHPLLILSGAMKAAALGGTGGVRRIDADSLDVAISLDVIPYARVHQEGYPEKNIPQREFMGFSEAVLDACEEVLVDDFVQEIFA